MNVLIEGLGSIALKHIEAIYECIPDAKIFALRSGKGSRTHPKVTDVFDLKNLDADIDFILISNPSHQHSNSISKFLEYGVPLFIEKPSLISLKGSAKLLEKVSEKGINTYVACNLRFLPIINFLKEEFLKNTPLEIRSYSGSYLPDWRPGMDYRKSYSALDEMGGGVHLDLIHELDYLFYLLGKPLHTYSTINKVSNLEITSKDYAHYHLEYQSTMVSVSLNYFRKVPKRDIEITFDTKVWKVDLLKSTITDLENGELIYSSDISIYDTYKLQMKYFLSMIKREKVSMNDLKESIEVLKICLNETA